MFRFLLLACLLAVAAAFVAPSAAAAQSRSAGITMGSGPKVHAEETAYRSSQIPR